MSAINPAAVRAKDNHVGYQPCRRPGKRQLLVVLQSTQHLIYRILVAQRRNNAVKDGWVALAVPAKALMRHR